MSQFLIIEVLISGFIIGIIFFQTTLSAPIVFKYLMKEQSSIYIRKIFPKIFALMFILGCLSTSINIFGNVQSVINLSVCITTALLSFTCYVMVPATNRATDSGNSKRFKLLHALSVGFTLVVLFSNLMWPFFI